MINKWIISFLIIGAIILVAFGLGGKERIDEIINREETNRPEYCDEVGCIPVEVFRNLPEMPKDFEQKWGMVYFKKISNLDLIGEEYWKQPEFYANTFEDQCMGYYTKLESSDRVRFNSAGSGSYPSANGATGVDRGETLKFSTFWHTGCGIARYQLFSLESSFPDDMDIKMENIKVNQNPEIARDCFDIKIYPEWILLDPNYPIFGYNHTRKIDMTIHVNENCPNGEYGINVLPGDPPKDVEERLQWKYGYGLSSMRVGSVWQIYIKVE